MRPVRGRSSTWVRENSAWKRVDLGSREAVAELLEPLRVGAAEDAVVQGLEGDPLLGQLALDVLVPVDTELGVVREVGADLEEERAEVLIEAVEVEVVDHRGAAHDPGVPLSRVGVAALLGAEDRRLLLSLAHEDDSLSPGEVRVVFLGDVVLALTLGERDQGDLLLLDEALDRGDERLADRVHESRGGEGLTAVEAEESRDTTVRLQARLIDVEVHAVDAFDLEGHVPAEDIGNGTWSSHRWLRSSRPFGVNQPLRGPIGDASAYPVTGTAGAVYDYISSV